MALLGQAQRESVFSESELDHFRRLVDYGGTFTYPSDKDGKDDTIKGVIEVQFKQQRGTDFDIFRFEEFKSYDVAGPNGPTAHFEKVHQRQGKLRFRADHKRRIAYAMVPDTRRNRDLLADMQYDHAGVIYLRENLKDREVPGEEVRRQIAEIALLRKGEREKIKRQNGGDTVDRTVRNMTPEQKKKMLDQLMAEENAKRTPLALNQTQTASTAAPVVVPAAQTTTANNVPAEPVNRGVTVVPAPRPEGAVTYQDMRIAAKAAVHEYFKADIETIKKKNVHWHFSKEYRTKIAPQIDLLVHKWAAEAKTENAMVT